MKELDEIVKRMRHLVYFSLGITALIILTISLKFHWIEFNVWHTADEQVVSASVVIEDTSLYGSVDAESGLIIDQHLDLVKAQCGACHSTRLVAQNKLTREGWKDLIVWMQAEQNLWDLGEQETLILDYLEKNCSPSKGGRRANLITKEWYVLNE